jgi:PAS domain S-box-containing protein
MKENNSPRKRTDKEKSANEDPITGQQVNIDAHTHEVDYLKSIIETQEELVVRFSLNGQVQFVNQAFCNLVGISHEKLIGRNLSSIFSFQSFPGLQQELTAMLAHPKRMILEDIVQHDGVKKWIQWTGFPIIARDNSIEVIQAVGHDITSLKRAEETIKVQRDLAMLLAESKNESIDYEKLGKIFSSLSSFSLFALYLFDAGKSSYELMNQNSVFSSDIKLLKNVKRNSKLGKLFQKTGTQYIRSTETEFKSILPILDPSLKGLGVLPIRLENSLFAAVIFGSAEFTELPTEIYTQLCAISKQLENFFIQLQTRSELYRHESDLTELFRSLEQMMLVIDRQGVVLDANRVLFDKLSDGKPKKELTIFDLHPAEYADLIRAAIDETIQQQHSILTLPFSDNENNQINVEVNFSYTSWKGSNKIIAVYKDISQQMYLRVMESEQREFASNLVAIAGTFNSSLDLDIILDHVIESVDKVVPISTANILLVDANQNGRVIRQRGYDRMGTEEVFTYRVFDLQKIKTFASMLASKQECLVSDTRAYPEWVPMPESFWVRSFISAPIVIKGKIYAFLNCDHATPGYFTEKHAARLKLLADQAAIAIENANVHFETKNRLRQIALVNELTQTMLNSPQPDDLLHTLSQKILDVFDAHSIMITQWLPETQTVTQLMSFGEGILPNLPKSFSFEDASITEYVISSKQALVINTEEEYQVWQKKVSRIFNDRVVMALPLIASDWPFGAILIGFNEPRQITPTEVSLGEYVSMQIATILNKSEIYQKAQLQSAQFEHANDLIASLSYVATTIMSAKGLNDTIQTMGDGLEKMNIHSFLFFKVSDE